MKKYLALLLSLVMIILITACGSNTAVKEDETADNGLLVKTNEEREYWIECEKDDKNVELDLDVKTRLFLEDYDETYNAQNYDEIPAVTKSFFGFLAAQFDEGTYGRSIGDEGWLAIDELNKGNVENYQEHIKNVKIALDQAVVSTETGGEDNQVTPVEGIVTLDKKISLNRISLMIPSAFEEVMDSEFDKMYSTDSYHTMISIGDERPELMDIEDDDQIIADSFSEWEHLNEEERILDGATVHICTYKTINDAGSIECNREACITNGSTYHYHVSIYKSDTEDPEEWVNEVFEEVYSTIEISKY